MDLLKGSTSISYFSSKIEMSTYKVEMLNIKVEVTLCKVEIFFNIWVYSSRIGNQVYTRNRETRPGPVISLDLERALLQSFQESKYPYV